VDQQSLHMKRNSKYIVSLQRILCNNVKYKCLLIIISRAVIINQLRFYGSPQHSKSKIFKQNLNFKNIIIFVITTPKNVFKRVGKKTFDKFKDASKSVLKLEYLIMFKHPFCYPVYIRNDD